MASKQQSATVYTCDNPKCETEHATVGGLKPNGYHFASAEVITDGGHTSSAPKDVYACKATCIRPAVQAVANLDDDPTAVLSVSAAFDNTDEQNEADEELSRQVHNGQTLAGSVAHPPAR